MEWRVGSGYDIHRLEPGRRLVIGGVEIEHELGLAGHSDADVLSHAVIDALLGAAKLGDIGRHFPPEDERWLDADSIVLLEKTVTMLGESGWQIGNIDATVIAERPRLSEICQQMEANLAAACLIDAGQVSAKATTNESLDAIGAGKGIAALATVLIKRG